MCGEWFQSDNVASRGNCRGNDVGGAGGRPFARPSEIKALGHCAPLVKAQGAQGWIDIADSSVGAKAPTP